MKRTFEEVIQQYYETNKKSLINLPYLEKDEYCFCYEGDFAVEWWFINYLEIYLNKEGLFEVSERRDFSDAIAKFPTLKEAIEFTRTKKDEMYQKLKADYEKHPGSFL